jgi:hypothetical protein
VHAVHSGNEVAVEVRHRARHTGELPTPMGLDGHLVGSIGEAAAETMFRITLRPGSSAGHDAIADDGRQIEIKATYGNTGVGIRATSHDHAAALIVLRPSRTVGVPHEIVYNGAFARVVSSVGGVQSNGQAAISLLDFDLLTSRFPMPSVSPQR